MLVCFAELDTDSGVVVQDGIHAASRRTRSAIQAAMHCTYEYLISSLDEQANITDQNTGLAFQLCLVS